MQRCILKIGRVGSQSMLRNSRKCLGLSHRSPTGGLGIMVHAKKATKTKFLLLSVPSLRNSAPRQGWIPRRTSPTFRWHQLPGES